MPEPTNGNTPINPHATEIHQRFEAAINAVQGVIWTNSANGEMLGKQDGWEKLTGQHFDEYQGLGWTTAVHPDDLKSTIKAWQESVAQKKPFITEHRLKLTDGTWADFSVRAIPSYNADGTVREWVGVHTNITEIKRSRAEILASEDRYQNFIKQSSEGIWRCELEEPIPINLPASEIIDLIFDRAYMAEGNDAMAKMYGYSNASDLTGLRLSEFFPRNEESEAYFRHFIESGFRVQDLESHEMTKTGEFKYFLNNFVGILKDGCVHRAWGTQRDVTKQKEAEKILEKSEENFRELADLIPQIIWTSSPEGKIDYYNKRWFEFTGNNDTSGDWTRLLHADDYKHALNKWGESISIGTPYQHEFRLKDRQGDYRWFLGKALPIRDEEGRLTKWFGTCTDIDDQKMMTAQLERKVAERTEALQRSNDDLHQFAHVASHDMKEPVRKIMTFASRISDEFAEELPDRAKQFLDKIIRAAHRSYSMIDGVLLYSSLSDGDQPAMKVELNEVIGNIIADWEVVINQKDALVRFSNLPEIQGSPLLLHQLFYNLIGNSLKFSSPERKPEIEITAASPNSDEIHWGKPADFVKIVLSDNGIGFNSDDTDRIFGAFTRLHSKDAYEGTGLGLALCKKIVERHGGTISAEGKPGLGALFSIILPKRSAEFIK